MIDGIGEEFLTRQGGGFEPKAFVMGRRLIRPVKLKAVMNKKADFLMDILLPLELIADGYNVGHIISKCSVRRIAVVAVLNKYL